MAERLSNLGYIAFIKETTAGVPLTPSFYTYAYKETLTTDQNTRRDNPVAGVPFASVANLRSVRSHTGNLEVYSDPNTLVYLLDMLMTRGTVTGAGPYTWPFTFGTADSNSFTMDISYGQQVVRFFGVKGSELGIKWDKDAANATMKVSALGSFHSRQIASTSGTGPTTITLDTTYDPAPTTGLVANDLLAGYHTGSAVLTTTVTSVTGTTVTVPGNFSTLVAGDTIYLRPATATYTLLTPLLWGMAQFRPGATAAAALSAAQVRIEQGSDFTVKRPFNNDKGEPRSGGFDPASLPRLQGDATLKIKKFFDTPEDLQDWQQLNKRAWVLRFFNGATSQYELRTTFHNVNITRTPKASLESAKIEYSEEEFTPIYDTGDASGVDVTVIANIPSF